jgi:hypothetical protein
MKGFFLGVLLLVVIGISGLIYRNAAEHPSQPIACPLDAEVCPDGTSVARTGNSCTFSQCLPPNVSLTDTGIAFAIPAGFASVTVPDATSVAEYDAPPVASTSAARIILRQYAMTASSTALEVIQQTAIGAASGAPVGATSFSSSVIGTHRFTIVSIERFEGVIDTAYYLARGTEVLRFDAIDTGVADWTNPDLTLSTLPAHTALITLLGSLQVL